MGSTWEAKILRMSRIEWKKGFPPDSEKGKHLLLIATPMGVNLDAAADNRPDVYVGHFSCANDNSSSSECRG